MTAKLPPEPKVQGQKSLTVRAGDVLPQNELHDCIRRTLRSKRAALDAAAREKAAQDLAHRLAGFFRSHPVAAIGSYLPVRGEIDPNGFRQLLGDPAPELYLPRLSGSTLEFVRWQTDTPLQPNRFGIPEPVEGPLLAPAHCPCFLIPLTAFDPYGRRIGSGGGFYDRTLAFCRDRPPGSTHPPLLIGVAYDFQCIDRIDPHPWDVPLDAVATEQCWYLGGQSWPELDGGRLVRA